MSGCVWYIEGEREREIDIDRYIDMYWKCAGHVLIRMDIRHIKNAITTTRTYALVGHVELHCQ